MIFFPVVIVIAAILFVVVLWVQQRSSQRNRNGRMRSNDLAAKAEALAEIDGEAYSPPPTLPPAPLKRIPMADFRNIRKPSQMPPQAIESPSIPAPLPVTQPLPVPARIKLVQGSEPIRLTWVGQGSQVVIRGVKLEHPMAYFFDSRNGLVNEEPAAIDMALPVGSEAYAPAAREPPFWPTYVGLTPGQRRNYIEWLAHRNQTIRCELGYAMILAWFAVTATPLPNWAAFSVAKSLPQSQRSVVVSRVGGEFEKLFLRQFGDKFPGGMPLSISKRQRRYTYRPANAALAGMSITTANPCGLTRQFTPVSDIWNLCIQELRKLSAVMNKAGGEVTVAAWEAMPAELRAGVNHPLSESFYQWIDKHMGQNGITIVKTSQLAGVLQVEHTGRLTPGQARRLCDRAAAVGYNLEPDARLTSKGYKPDESLAVFLKVLDAADEPARYKAAACMMRIVLTVAAAGRNLDSEAAGEILTHVRNAFGLNEDEYRRLHAMRELAGNQPPDLAGVARLTKTLTMEQRQAIAKLAIALAAADGVVTAAELRAVRKCYTILGLQTQEAEEVLKSILAPPRSSDEPVTVQNSQPGSAGEPIPPAPRDTGGSAIPGRAHEGLHLDRAAIAAIMRDTQEVADMLAAAMGADTEPTALQHPQDLVQPPTDFVATSSPANDDGMGKGTKSASGAMGVPSSAADVKPARDCLLPSRFAEFYQLLITKPRWSLSEAEAMARKHGHMLSGAIESINEWAMDNYGAQLFFDDGNQLVLEREVLQ